MAVLFDTLKLSRRLEQAGFTRDQAVGAAEALSEAISGDLATKADIAELRAEIVALGSELRAEIATLGAELRTEFRIRRTNRLHPHRNRHTAHQHGAVDHRCGVREHRHDQRGHVCGLAARRAPLIRARPFPSAPRRADIPPVSEEGPPMQITPTGPALGARITGIDLARPISEAETAALLAALGAHGVLCFPDQDLDAAALAAFGRRFGDIGGQRRRRLRTTRTTPEVMILSNMKQRRAAARR